MQDGPEGSVLWYKLDARRSVTPTDIHNMRQRGRPILARVPLNGGLLPTLNTRRPANATRHAPSDSRDKIRVTPPCTLLQAGLADGVSLSASHFVPGCAGAHFFGSSLSRFSR
jgi:hypothetical protein